MRRIPWLLIGLLLSATLVLVLAWQNRELRQQKDALEKRAFEPYVGMWVPEIPAKSLDGAAVVIGTAPKQFQVLYFFTSTCPYCKQSAPLVRKLAEQLASDSTRVQMLGVADGESEAVRRYVNEHGFGFPVTTLSDRRKLALFKAQAVPLLVVVDAQGRVRHSHLGVFDRQDEMDAILKAVTPSQEAKAAKAAGPG
ncbi:TlpA family protein disulfide reductase [Luteimonas panaciterrae]|uniref:TlpA family protein disulfide reductase n=1 Tax=Luteimonas panaciterrae TaxID=363885 RepID=UPI001CF978CA|nr:TlpA disulfide reductase family protein [Luteimonas panaciterrae]